MKKFIASALSAAILLSSASMSVFAEATSSAYTIDSSAKTISKVAPLTTVAAFKNNISGAEVKVYNVDGSEMTTGYATDNVYATLDGERYDIIVKYGYTPIRDTGSALADGTSLYNVAANAVNNNSLTGSGFTRLESWAKIGYGSDNASPSSTAAQTVKGEKQTINGETVYKLENDSSKYAYIRSHYSSSTNYSTTLNSIRDTWATTPIVTTVEFEADKLGNISVFNNTPVRNDSKAITKGDSSAENLVYAAELPYVPNSVHFLDDGSVKLGGIYSNYTTAQRTPIQTTSFTWQPGQKYTVSIIQRYLRGTRNGYVDAVYVNGTKIFPNANTVSHGDSRVALQGDGTFKIGTKTSSITHGGDLSSIMIGTAPKTADDNLTVYLSDVKVYGVSAYNPAMDVDITLTSSDNTVEIDNADAEITYCGSIDPSDFNVPVKIDGNVLTAVSADGLASKAYSLTNTYDPAAVSDLTQVYGSDGSVDTESDGVWAKAFTFTVTPNDDTVSTVKVTAKDSNNETLKQESWTGSLSGEGNVSFGIIAATRTEGGLDGITFTPSIEIQ